MSLSLSRLLALCCFVTITGTGASVFCQATAVAPLNSQPIQAATTANAQPVGAAAAAPVAAPVQSGAPSSGSGAVSSSGGEAGTGGGAVSLREGIRKLKSDIVEMSRTVGILDSALMTKRQSAANSSRVKRRDKIHAAKERQNKKLGESFDFLD